jgi:hypothetical protein
MISPDIIGKKIIKCIYDNGTIAEEIGNYSIKQCHTTTVTTIAPSTGKLVIHVGTFDIQNYILSNNFRVYMDSNYTSRKQQYNHVHV